MTLYAYVIMENHAHIVSAAEQLGKEIGNFKSYTARKIIDRLTEMGAVNVLDRLSEYKLVHKSDRTYQLWQEGSHPKLIQGDEMMRQKIRVYPLQPSAPGLCGPADPLALFQRSQLCGAGGADSGDDEVVDWAQSARLHSHAERGSEHSPSRSHTSRSHAPRGNAGDAPASRPVSVGYRFGTRSTGSVRHVPNLCGRYRVCASRTGSVDGAQHPCVAYRVHRRRTAPVRRAQHPRGAWERAQPPLVPTLRVGMPGDARRPWRRRPLPRRAWERERCSTARIGWRNIEHRVSCINGDTPTTTQILDTRHSIPKRTQPCPTQSKPPPSPSPRPRRTMR